jgi:hypothetical protein
MHRDLRQQVPHDPQPPAFSQQALSQQAGSQQAFSQQAGSQAFSQQAGSQAFSQQAGSQAGLQAGLQTRVRPQRFLPQAFSQQAGSQAFSQQAGSQAFSQQAGSHAAGAHAGLQERRLAMQSLRPPNRSQRCRQTVLQTGLHAGSQAFSQHAGSQHAFSQQAFSQQPASPQPPQFRPSRLSRRSMPNPWLHRATLTRSAPKMVLPLIEQQLLYNEPG